MSDPQAICKMCKKPFTIPAIMDSIIPGLFCPECVATIEVVEKKAYQTGYGFGLEEGRVRALDELDERYRTQAEGYE